MYVHRGTNSHLCCHRSEYECLQSVPKGVDNQPISDKLWSVAAVSDRVFAPLTSWPDPMALPSASLGLFSLDWSEQKRQRARPLPSQYEPYHSPQLKHSEEAFQSFQYGLVVNDHMTPLHWGNARTHDRKYQDSFHMYNLSQPEKN
jgi:hypothetical protein